MAEHGTRAAGPCVAITRPAEAAGELIDLLTSAGARTLLTPLTRIVAPVDGGPLLQAISRLDSYDWVVFTSANAVRAVAGCTRRGNWTGPRIAAVGPATAAAVRDVLESTVDVLPDEFTGAGLAMALSGEVGLENARVLWPRAEHARRETAEALRAAGARLDDPVAYRSVPDADVARQLSALAEGGAVDVITFTAPSAVHAFAEAHGRRPLTCLVAAIGPTTAQAARDRGFEVNVEPSENTVPALARAIVSRWQEG